MRGGRKTQSKLSSFSGEEPEVGAPPLVHSISHSGEGPSALSFCGGWVGDVGKILRRERSSSKQAEFQLSIWEVSWFEARLGAGWLNLGQSYLRCPPPQPYSSHTQSSVNSRNESKEKLRSCSHQQNDILTSAVQYPYLMPWTRASWCVRMARWFVDKSQQKDWFSNIYLIKAWFLSQVHLFRVASGPGTYSQPCNLKHTKNTKEAKSPGDRWERQWTRLHSQDSITPKTVLPLNNECMVWFILTHFKVMHILMYSPSAQRPPLYYLLTGYEICFLSHLSS